MSTPAASTRRIRQFYFYRPDGSLCGSMGGTDHPGFEASVRAGAAAHGAGVIEHDGELDLSHDRVDVTTGQLIDPVDYEFARDLERKWQSVLQAFPVLANPVPPAPVPKSTGGTQRFRVSEFWAEFTQRAAAGEWTPRAPEVCTELTGPFRSSGVCLEPVRTAGDLTWYDVATPAQDDDMVLVRWDSLELQRIYERSRDNPEWLSIYPVPNPLATKVLKAFGGQYWLCCAESMLQLGKNTVLGVQRRCVRNLYPQATPVPNIVPNAATQIYSAQDDGPDTHNPAANGDGYLTVSGSGIDTASVLNGSLTIDASVAAPLTTIANIALQVTWSGGAEATASAQPLHTDLRNYSFQHSFTALPPNTAWTMRVAMSGNASCTVQRATIRAEAIKR